MSVTPTSTTIALVLRRSGSSEHLGSCFLFFPRVGFAGPRKVSDKNMALDLGFLFLNSPTSEV